MLSFGQVAQMWTSCSAELLGNAVNSVFGFGRLVAKAESCDSEAIHRTFRNEPPSTPRKFVGAATPLQLLLGQFVSSRL